MEITQSNIRLIPRLDIKGKNLIKSVHLEGLRVIGDPQEHALKYYQTGADELIYMDCVASLYGRNSLNDLLKKTVQNIFIPITVGGGIRSVENAREILQAGADKIAINTAAIERPTLIKEIAQQFGSQCMVLSIEAKKTADNQWEAYTHNGREKTGKTVIDWAQEAEKLGAGEILLTSIDQEGTGKGFDNDLIKQISTTLSIPVIASGGMGNAQHLINVIKDAKADAVAIADVLHYQKMTLPEIRKNALEANIHVRNI